MTPKNARQITIGGQFIWADSSHKAQFLRECKYEILKIAKITSKGDRFRNKGIFFRIYDTIPDGAVKITKKTKFEYVPCCAFCDYIFKDADDYNKHLKKCPKIENK